MGFLGKREPETVDVSGKPLRCQICGNPTFWRKRGSLHGAFASFLSLEWLSPSCACVICSSCGFIHWFFPRT